ncbi:MAG: hypothetical protein U0Q07_20465 [Acidimicrobiales bacterium]
MARRPRRFAALLAIGALVALPACTKTTSDVGSPTTAAPPATEGTTVAPDTATTRTPATRTPSTRTPSTRRSTTTSAESDTVAGAWTPVDPPAAGAYDQLVSAQCNGPDSCSVDGIRADQSNVLTDYLVHWDGSTWSSSNGPSGSASAPPTPGELDCLDDFCIVPIDNHETTQLAVPEIQQVQGGKWAGMNSDVVVVRDPLLLSVSSVSCPSSSFCVAVGYGRNQAATSSAPIVSIWNGEIWKTAALSSETNMAVQILRSVSCSSTSDCLAVGVANKEVGTPADVALVFHWDGQQWTEVPVPTSQARTLDAVICSSASFCLAVGGNGNAGAVLRWDGRSLTDEESPLSGPLYAVGCSSEDLCMAIPSPPSGRPLVSGAEVAARIKGSWYTVSDYPAKATHLSGVSCYDGGCLVVGWSRSTPSSDGSDIVGAVPTAAFWDLTSG